MRLLYKDIAITVHYYFFLYNYTMNFCFEIGLFCKDESKN